MPPVTESAPRSHALTHVALVCADWRTEAVAQARRSTLAELQRGSGMDLAIEAFEVPDAQELPLMAKKLAGSGRYQAIIACGSASGHAPGRALSDLVDGLMRVQLATAVPVFSVLVSDTEPGAPDDPGASVTSSGFFSDRHIRKGQAVAQACLASLADQRLARRSA